jgi:peptide/nickel transport system permease protein
MQPVHKGPPALDPPCGRAAEGPVRDGVIAQTSAAASRVWVPGGRAWRRFRRHALAVSSVVVIALLIFAACFAPALTAYTPVQQDLDFTLAPPSLAHLMGTDDLGRDVFARVLFGARASLAVAFSAVAILIGVGTIVGLLAGYYRSLDGPLMRCVDLLMSVPNVFLILAIVALFGPGLWRTMTVIGITSWMATARLVRGQLLSMREQEFVEAARAVGANDRRIIWSHLVPNLLTLITVQTTLYVSYAVITESLLSYLGLGAQPPTPSWGNILSDGRNFMRDAWWLTLFPGLAIFVTVMAFNFVGDGLRDALDPRGQTA